MRSKFTHTNKKVIRKVFHGLGIINTKPLAQPVASDRIDNKLGI